MSKQQHCPCSDEQSASILRPKTKFTNLNTAHLIQYSLQGWIHWGGVGGGGAHPLALARGDAGGGVLISISNIQISSNCH